MACYTIIFNIQTILRLIQTCSYSPSHFFLVGKGPKINNLVAQQPTFDCKSIGFFIGNTMFAFSLLEKLSFTAAFVLDGFPYKY